MINFDKKCTQWLPVMNSESGLCLTPENWFDAGVSLAAFRLNTLFMKPGMNVLSVVDSLAAYTGGFASVAINASMLTINHNGICRIRSIYDGKIIDFSIDDILACLVQLQPQFVVLPQGMHQYFNQVLQIFPEDILLFFPAIEQPEWSTDRAYGVYFEFDPKSMSFSSLLYDIKRYAQRPCYVAGDLTPTELQTLSQLGILYLESDVPTRDGFEGLIYVKDGILDLKNEDQNMRFDAMDDACQCAICRQGMTRAYLHHLYFHTPLLCQRFLIMHNTHYVTHRII